MTINNRGFISDNWARTVRLNYEDDKTLSKYDFYNDKVLNELKYYNPKGDFNQVTPYTENILVGEKYFSGLGCEFLPDVAEMIEDYNQLPNLRKIGVAALAFIVILLILSFIFQFLYFKEKKKLMLIIVFIMTICSFLAFILLLSHLIISRGAYDKILAYQNGCKNNPYSQSYNRQYTSTMEIDYLYSLFYIRTFGGVTLLVVLGNLGSLALMLLTCRCW